jgi:phosphinothricin acetyltransferase
MNERAGPLVRLVTEDDLGGVCEIVNYFIEKTVFNFRTEPQVVDEWRDQWRRLHSRFPWLLATNDDRLVGVAYTGPWNHRVVYQWTVEVTVYVDASAHRRGVGDALYTELLARLRRQGFRSAVAVIAPPNDPSVRLHERYGFIQVGQLGDAGYKVGAAGTMSDSGSAYCAAAAMRQRRRCPSRDEHIYEPRKNRQPCDELARAHGRLRAAECDRRELRL